MNNQGRNPPWIQQKNVAQQYLAPQIGLQQQLLQQNQMGQFLQNHHVSFSNAQMNAQPMIQMNQLHQVPPVQYSTARVNPMAFQNPHQQQNQNIQQQQQQQSNSKYNANNKNFSGTGVVTVSWPRLTRLIAKLTWIIFQKIQNDIGFIDDEVLFHKSVCVGKIEPKIGDLVLLEATVIK